MIELRLSGTGVPQLDQTINVLLNGEETTALVTGLDRDGDTLRMTLLHAGDVIPVQAVLVLPADHLGDPNG